ncbi:hypothetical protein IQ249_03350 [Lusitaniella coriacea LEGE 07157]|uniref:Uncharacterized protein n=1 Tax=Lusitaniella coriacea LEGE 07157 TaxID=945747 RepID=A0A8J7AWT2_9CYAN|nr:hypothetical protein [Lusitaniella coriacea LEGE 07157]
MPMLLYPDINEAGSLASLLRATAKKADINLNIEGNLGKYYAICKLGQRSSQVMVAKEAGLFHSK